jgi:hypothetical protein
MLVAFTKTPVMQHIAIENGPFVIYFTIIYISSKSGDFHKKKLVRFTRWPVVKNGTVCHPEIAALAGTGDACQPFQTSQGCRCRREGPVLATKRRSQK